MLSLLWAGSRRLGSLAWAGSARRPKTYCRESIRVHEGSRAGRRSFVHVRCNKQHRQGRESVGGSTRLLRSDVSLGLRGRSPLSALRELQPVLRLQRSSQSLLLAQLPEYRAKSASSRKEVEGTWPSEQVGDVTSERMQGDSRAVDTSPTNVRRSARLGRSSRSRAYAASSAVRQGISR